jgi:branched-chain amino acid transport system permease protein
MSTLNTLIEATLYGLSLGMLYALVALGLTLIFGLMDVINLAHGAMVTLGAYLGISVYSWTGSFWVAMVALALAVGSLGAVVERGLVRKLYDINHVFQLLLTFGIGLIIEGAILVHYGEGGKSLSPPPVLQGDPVHVGPAVLPIYRVFIIVFTGLLILGVWLLIQRTDLGLIIRAGIQDRERTQLMGIRLSRVNLFVFSLGSALAAVAGFLAGPVLSVDPSLGTGLLITSFVVIVVGGLGNISGTIVSAILIGILYNIALFFYPSVANALIFVFMLVVLIARPRGLFGGVSA